MIDMGELRLIIPDDLHKTLKVKAASEGKTLKHLVVELLKKGIGE